MKRYMMVAAVVLMAATGCVNTSQFLRKDSDATNSFSRSARQDSAVQTVSYNTFANQGGVRQSGGLMYGLTNNHLQNCCCDECCETVCGYPDECCEAGCGYGDECCDTCCDPCCGCDDSGCGLFKGGLLGKKRNKKSRCNGQQCNNGNCYGNGCNGGCGDNCRCGPCARIAGCIASGGCNPHSGGYPEWYNFNPGPQGGQVAYPYYTTRGPRDFLMCNPQPLGPY